MTIAAVNAARVRRRLRAGDGLRLPDRRRSRRRSASPRSTSGSSPASAAPSGCRGSSARAKALELNLTGDPIDAERAYELGLATRVVPDHELLDTALQWARKLAGQAPLAIEQIKRVSAAGDLDAGIEAEKRGVRDRVRLRRRPRGDLGVPAEARAAVRGHREHGRRHARRAARRADPASPTRSSR